MPRPPKRSWDDALQISRPVPGAKRVEVVVVGADVEPPAGERERSLHLAAGAVAPDRLPRLRVEREDVAVPVADVDAAVRDERRGLARADRPPPAHAARARVERDHLAVQARRRRLRVTGVVPLAAEVQERHVDELARDRRRGGGAAARHVPPARPPGRRLHRVEHTRVVRDVGAPVGDRRRELEQVPPVEHPGDSERRRQPARQDTAGGDRRSRTSASRRASAPRACA